MLEKILWFIKLIFSPLYYLLNRLDVGNAHSSIYNFIWSYWAVFLFFNAIIIAWYLIVYIFRYTIIYNTYSRIRELGTLRLMTRIAEGYYLLDKLCDKVKPKSIKTYIDNRNEFRKFRDFGPISIISFIKSLVLQMFKFSIFNILIWLTMLVYFQPSIIQDLQNFFLTTKCNQIAKIFTLIKLGDIKKLYDDMYILALIPVIFFNAFGFYQKSSQVAQSNDEENIKKAFEYQDKLEKLLAKVILKIEENVDCFSKQIEFFPTYYCGLITNEKYSIYKNKLSKSMYSKYTSDTIEDYANNYEAFDEDIKSIVDLLKVSESKDVRFIIRKLNKSAIYEYKQLSLYSYACFKYTAHDFLEQNEIRKFFEVSISDEDYLKESIPVMK